MWTRLLLVVSVLAGACSAERTALAPLGEGAPAASQIDWSGAVLLEVTLQDFAFAPSRLELARQHPYRLHLNNTGGGHNFDAPAFFRTVVFRDDASSQRVRSAGGVIELAGDESLDVYVLPVRQGRYALRCSHLFHSSFGHDRRNRGELTERATDL